MFEEYFDWSADTLSVIGVLAISLVVGKFALGIFRFLNGHFLCHVLGLAADLKKAGSWAVVTGCTDGIGKAYAEQLAAKGLNMVLISRTLSKLTDMAKEVEDSYKVKTLVIRADFSQADIYDYIRSKLEFLDVAVLVNNVALAYDHPEYFAELDTPKFVEDMLHINCLSYTKMTQIVLPNMVKKRSGFVINIGSVAGSQPTPFFSLYSGTKTFVEVFTRSLDLEYQEKGITFQIVMPNYVVSKQSKRRRSSLFVPSPASFARGALATVGVQAATTGYWAHSLQNVYLQFVPKSVIINNFLHIRKLALKKKADRKQN